MQSKIFNRLALLTGGAVALALACAPATAKDAPKPAPAPATAPAAAAPAAGEAGIFGIWLNPYGGHRLGDPDNPKLVRPATVVPKLTPEYAEKTKHIEETFTRTSKGDLTKADPEDFVTRRQIMCIPYGMPRTMTRNMSLDILNGGDHITIVGELDREIRRIWMNRDMKPADDIVPGYWGYSVGHWEGKVLVVKTIGIKAEIFGEEFLAHSDNMVIDERIYESESGILYDEITMTDPEAFETPFKYTAIFNRAPKDFEPSEFVCDELPVHVIGPDGQLTLNSSAL